MTGRSTHPTRRSLLLAAAAAPLAGCGIRLERDAPAIPGVPTATPPADSVPMQDAVHRLRRVAQALIAQEPREWTTRLRTLHTAQADRLIRVAASAGIAISDPPVTSSTSTSAPTTTGTASSGVTTSPAPTHSPGAATTSPTTVIVHPAAATEADAITAAAVTAAAGAGQAHRPALLATLAGHRAGARLLGRTDLPVSTGLDPAAAAHVLEPVRAAVYLAELLIAKTPAKQRAELSSLLTQLYAERMRLGVEAAGRAAPEQLSYAMPAEAEDPARARTTVAGLLQTCVLALASQSARATAPRSATRQVQLWGDLVATAWAWGAEPETFLGLG